MASEVHLTLTSKFVRRFMNTVRTFIKLLGPAIIQPPPGQILRMARMDLDSILSVWILSLDWVRTVYHLGSEILHHIADIDGSLKGDSHSHFRFGRSNDIDAINIWKLQRQNP
jgi:hypothetical protein